MTLRQERVLFTRLITELLTWARQTYPRWEIAFDEVTVHSPRAAHTEHGRMMVKDAVHRSGSRHHNGCAADLLLYIDGVWISEGGRLEWRVLGEQWESMHERAAWGGRFGDAGHFSLAAEDGRK